MRKPFATAGPGFCRWRGFNLVWIGPARQGTRPGRGIADLSAVRARSTAESGFSLIEVLVASLITAVIAVGTLTGIDAADHGTADTRSHAQATQLAGQDEERLRGFTTTVLGQLGSATTNRAENGSCLEAVTGVWHYWSKGTTTFCENPTGLSGAAYVGTVYTVASSATYVSAETGGTKSSLTCETTAGTANYLQTTSSVTWNSLGKREPVSQSSIITVPTSNTLQVKVLNQKNEPVEGATVTVSGISPELSQSTPSAGCVVFGGLSATSVKATATKVGWVNENGEETPTAKSATVSKTATTAIKFVIAEPGGIRANFFAAGGGKVSGSTFYAFQTAIAAPDGYVGGSAASYTEAAELGKILFPFRNVSETPSGPNPYTVFAGDCEANNPHVVNPAVTDTTAQVEPNATTPVEVHMPKVNVTVKEGTLAAPKGVFAGVEHAMIVNKGCEAAAAARNGSTPYKHEVTISGGALVPAYQPYAKELTLCVVVHNTTTKKYYKYSKTFENKGPTESSWGTIYPEESATKSETPSLTCP
ncbi:MAG TPA: prepilin-type N-terminal cleavage/methylation domain-containing protein [Solirubrobacteraceae bacterium]|jgi:prepilin-type N-terminal cleavage/methylation domain-containing protein|nr:prepilin-type N-terminal cleavage/methylation domain-containing protein [Solirubrobacteraceae bacterium]